MLFIPLVATIYFGVKSEVNQMPSLQDDVDN